MGGSPSGPTGWWRSWCSPFFGDLLGLPAVDEATLWVLAAASTYTVAFRVLKVRRQALAEGALPE